MFDPGFDFHSDMAYILIVNPFSLPIPETCLLIQASSEQNNNKFVSYYKLRNYVDYIIVFKD